jgi:hypothetical protein
MNEDGKEAAVDSFKVLSQLPPDGTEENHQNPQLG